MASMTDIIFLLLIFFLITSTVVVPNSIKVNLPQSQIQTAAKLTSRITIDANLNYYVATGRERERRVSYDDILPFLQEQQAQEPEMFVGLYADATVPYGEVIKIVRIATENNFKMVFITQRVQR